MKRGVAQSGSALALGARCREFKSLYPDQFGSSPSTQSWRIRFSKERIPPIGARVSGFLEVARMSLEGSFGARPRSVVTVAQLVEPWTVTPVVAGSNPVSHPTIFS